MGWQEYPENDDNFLPLTEDELREFQTKTEKVNTPLGFYPNILACDLHL